MYIAGAMKNIPSGKIFFSMKLCCGAEVDTLSP
jgi:hypothetical protein